MRKWQNVLILGWKRCFVQPRALCWKSLKSGGRSAKMTKHADLVIKALFCTNSCTLLKKAKKCCTKCENDNTCWSWAENAVLYKLVYKTRVLVYSCTRNRLKVLHPVRKWGNVLISVLKTLFWTNWCPSLKIAKKWSAQCENVKTCWSRANNAVLLFGQTRALCWKELKSVPPVRKWRNVLISGRKRCFGKTDVLCWKSLKSGVPSAEMLKRADLRLKKLFFTNSCTYLKTLRSCVPRV